MREREQRLRLEIKLDELHDQSSELVKSFKAEGKGGWGLGALSLGGSYERNSEQRRHEATTSNGILSVPGLQAIGCVAKLIAGPCPNPRPGLNFVGGK